MIIGTIVRCFVQSYLWNSSHSKRAVSTGMNFTNHRKLIAIESDRIIQYQEVTTGSLTNTYNNVGCIGYSRMLNGKKRDSIVSLATYTVVLRNINVGYNRKDDVLIDLHSHTTMNSICVQRQVCKVENPTDMQEWVEPLPFTSPKREIEDELDLSESNEGDSQDAGVSFPDTPSPEISTPPTGGQPSMSTAGGSLPFNDNDTPVTSRPPRREAARQADLKLARYRPRPYSKNRPKF